MSSTTTHVQEDDQANLISAKRRMQDDAPGNNKASRFSDSPMRALEQNDELDPNLKAIYEAMKKYQEATNQKLAETIDRLQKHDAQINNHEKRIQEQSNNSRAVGIIIQNCPILPQESFVSLVKYNLDLINKYPMPSGYKLDIEKVSACHRMKKPSATNPCPDIVMQFKGKHDPQIIVAGAHKFKAYHKIMRENPAIHGVNPKLYMVHLQRDIFKARKLGYLNKIKAILMRERGFRPPNKGVPIENQIRINGHMVDPLIIIGKDSYNVREIPEDIKI